MKFKGTDTYVATHDLMLAVNAAITLEKGKPNSVFDNDGSALVIHAQADDYKTDPAGNAGGRVACGVIQESGATSGRLPGK